MISQLRGTIDFKGERFVIVDVGGVGYKVFCSKETLDKIPIAAQPVKLFTHLVLKERETIELYGFLSFDGLDLFERLLNISGVGPRAALNLASFESVGQLKEALGSGKKVIPGIGPKKVQKILLELGEKLEKVKSQRSKFKSNENEDAVGALASLGVSRQRAREIVGEIPEEIKGTENIVKEALKRLGR